MSNQKSEQYLVISALGKDRPGIVNDLSQQLVEAGCNMLDSRMTVLGGEFAVLMLIEGQWNAIAKLEAQLPELEKQLKLTLVAKRTEGKKLVDGGRPYNVEVIALDHPGIVYQVANFFSSKQINIQDLYTDSYRAAHTGAQMFAANITINIPPDVQIARLREDFLEFCDALNLDAMMEPIKV